MTISLQLTLPRLQIIQYPTLFPSSLPQNVSAVQGMQSRIHEAFRPWQERGLGFQHFNIGHLHTKLTHRDTRKAHMVLPLPHCRRGCNFTCHKTSTKTSTKRRGGMYVRTSECRIRVHTADRREYAYEYIRSRRARPVCTPIVFATITRTPNEPLT